MARQRAVSGGLSAALELCRGPFRLRAELEAPAGQVTALVGASGAGKTTLLRCLAGLERHCRGRIAVGEAVWQDSAAGRWVAPHRRRLGLVFQEGLLFPHLSVAENLRYGWRRVPAGEQRLRLEEVAAWVGLEPLLARPVEGLSGGERQRVALARALLSSPAVLLLDEPLAGLDVAAKGELLAYLERCCQALAAPVVYVSHTRAEVLRLADRVVLLAAGEVVAAGSLAVMAARLAALPGEGEEAAVVVEARVHGEDERDGLTLLAFAGGELAIPRQPLPAGTRHRVQVLARDVSVCLDPPRRTSILNVFPARVVALHEPHGEQPLLELRVAEATLLARVTRRSLRELGLVPGSAVYAQVKAVALQ